MAVPEQIEAPVAAASAGSGSVAMQRALRRVATPLLLLLAWQAGSTIGLLDPGTIPSPLTVIEAWWQWIAGAKTPLGWYSGTWLEYVAASTSRVLLGFSIAAVLGVTIGILIGWNAIFSDLVDPVVQILRPIPMTAWLPFATVFFGVQEGAAIFLIAMGAFFTIVVNCTAGAQQTPKNLVRAALMLGTSPHALLLRVVLPSALPSIFTGLRLGIGVGWVLVIVAEMLAVKGGIGYAMWTAYQFSRADLIIAAMATIGGMGLLTDMLLVVVGNRLLRWNVGLRAR